MNTLIMLTAIVAAVISFLIVDYSFSVREVNELDNFYNELKFELHELEKESEKFMYPPPIKNIQNEKFNNSKTSSTIITKTEPISINKYDFNYTLIDEIKDLSYKVDEGFVIPKRTVAKIMEKRDKMNNEKHYMNSYMYINNRIYLTQHGINQISEKCQSVINDIINSMLIIKFYETYEVQTSDKNIPLYTKIA